MGKKPLILTNGERLLISRRRLGLSQEAMAKRYGISRTQYGRVERDLEEGSIPIPKSEDTIPNSQEKWFILRKRAGLRQKDIANELGLSRFWINQMELGLVPDTKLRDFWGHES